MKKLYFISLILISVILSSGCQKALIAFSGHNVDEIYADLNTPEPGTTVDPVAKVVLMEAEKIVQNPDSVKNKYEFLLELKPQYNNQTDTIISNGKLNVPIRIYKKWTLGKKKDIPVILFFHGGSFLEGHGDLETHDLLCRNLANRSNYIIVSVDYRLAPTHKFPAAIDDAYFALNWVSEHIHKWGGAKEKIAVMGDSAGGNIATVMTLLSQENNGPNIQAQVLYYPAVTFEDTITNSKEYFTGRHGGFYILSEPFLYEIKNSYQPKDIPDDHPYLSPLRANLNKDLPPALIITAQCDPLRDEGKMYADYLKKAGVEVSYINYPEMIHAFISMNMIFKEGDQAINQGIEFLKTKLEPEKVKHFADN